MSVKVSPVDTADDATSTSFTITSDWHRYSSLLRLTWEALAPKRGASSLRIVDPKMYMRASNELITLALIVCWTITLIVDPSQIIEHPGHSFTGDYNPCFGWDYPPASYIAVILNSTNVYWTWRYAWLETTRSAMLPETGLQQCGNQPVRQAGLEVLFTNLAASTQRESAWRPCTRRLRLTHPNV